MVQDAGYKVVLSGEGADEVFWGYDTFRELFIRLMWQRNPDSKYRPEHFKKIFPYFPQYQDDRYFNFLNTLATEDDVDLTTHLIPEIILFSIVVSSKLGPILCLESSIKPNLLILDI